MKFWKGTVNGMQEDKIKRPEEIPEATKKAIARLLYRMVLEDKKKSQLKK